MEECDIHPGNTKHFYCSQHYDLFCVDCSTEHLDCLAVTFLTEISETSNSMLAHLKRQKEGFQSLIEDSVTCIAGTEQKKGEILQYVEQVRSDFNRFIDNLEQDINTCSTQFLSDIRCQIGLHEEQIKTIQKSLITLNNELLLRKHNKDVQRPSSISSESEHASLLLTQPQHNLSLVKEQPVTLPAKFDLLKDFERQLQDGFEKTEAYSQTTSVEWICSSTQTAAVQSRNVTSACLDRTVLQPASSKTDLYQTSYIGVDTFTLQYPQYCEKVILSDVQVPVETEGEGRCVVTGCAVVQDDRVVIADWYNRCVKLVKVPDMIQSCDNVGTEAGHQQTGTGRSSVLCKLKLSGRPRDVTVISQDQVAVTLPDDSEVQILKVDQNILTFVRKISTEDNYWGITYGQGTLIMVNINQKYLTVATLQEKVSVIKVLQYTPVDDGRRVMFGLLLNDGWYVTAAEDRTVYVTNCADDTVTRLTLAGEVLGQYTFKGLREPLGICVHPTDGTVFICYRQSNCILRMSPDGQEIQRFKVSRPHSVYVTGENRIIVGKWRRTLQMLHLS